MVFDIFRKKDSEDASLEEERAEAISFNKKNAEEMEIKQENKRIIEVMKKVQDPELGLDIWTLGLIYDLEVKDKVNIRMTFTTPMCPYGPQILFDLRVRLKQIGIEDPNIQLIFDPPWQPSDEVREALGV